MEISERLRTIRLAKNISVYRIAKETGISPNHITDLEHGRRNPSVETLKRLVVPLGITMSELFCDDETVAYLSEKERKLVENYRMLPDEKGEFLLQMSSILNK